MNRNQLIGIATPAFGSSAVPKSYVDNVKTSLDFDIVSLDTKITANRTDITNVIKWLQTHHGYPT